MQACDSVHKEFARFEVVHNVNDMGPAWSALRHNLNCTISDVSVILGV